MTYPVYAEYEDSGVEWLGKIPKHWNVLPLKRTYRIVGGSTPPAGDENWNGDIVWVTPADLSQLANFDIVDSNRKISETGLHSCGASLVAKGSIVLSTRAPIGSLGIANLSLTTNQGCKALVPTGPVCSRFHAYQLSTLKNELNVRGRGSTFMELSREELGIVSISFPPVEEQQKIAAFLDRKTSEIDNLIAKKRRLLDLLAEKRTALITRAVTKGLNPDAPMKDSGIEWLGEIPAHWEVVRLRHVTEKIEQGWSPQCENRPANIGEWGVLKVGCVNDDAYDESGNKALPAELSPKEQYEIRQGDILISRANTRELLGSATLVDKTQGKILLCDKLYRVKTRDNIDNGFLVRMLRSIPSRFQYERDGTGTSGSMQNIGQDTLKDLTFACPPIDEQREIDQWLAVALIQFDQLQERIESAVETLQEYRSALITNAVTGQIKVA